MGIETGAGVWVQDKQFGWRAGEIVASDDKGVQVKVAPIYHDITEELIAPEPDELVVIPPNDDICFQNPDTEDGGGVEDMTTLNYLHEPAIQHNIKKRFLVKKPYTYTGNICIAVNPYMWLPLYGENIMAKYCNTEMDANPPHVYAIAERAYRSMIHRQQNQSILVSGESGAGKTETTKIVMGFLGHVFDFDGNKVDGDNHNDIDVDLTVERVLQSNPVLETFGNAKTMRNNNSSRFGKWIEMQFDGNGRLVGAKIRTYLLEKSRVVGLAAGERSYHSFYQLLAGSTPEDRTRLGLGTRTAKDFKYLNQSECYTADGIDDVKEYHITSKAMQVVGVSEAWRTKIWEVVAAILHLGEVEFEVEKEFAVVKNISSGPISHIARLLQVDPNALAASLCQLTLVIRKDTTIKRLTVEQASDARHALAKGLYGRVFNWLVDTINRTIQNDSECKAFVGILDIFGFEFFQNNSFEQFCINYANEKLQQQFTRDTFKSVQDEYTDEGIEWSYVDFQDNQKCLDLMERGACVLSMLNEECMVNGTDMGFVHKMHTVFRAHKHFAIDKKNKELFGIVHYAAKVMYHCHGFLEKNRDPLSDDIVTVLRHSSCSFVAEKLFAVEEQQDDNKTSGGGGGKKGANTVGTQFKTQLDSLMATIAATSVSYIRCIKPNSQFSSANFDQLNVLNQLRYSGVLEAVRISRAAYPNRQGISDFVTRFRCLLPNSTFKATVADPTVASRENLKNAVLAICSAVPSFKSDDKKIFQLGKTKAYFGLGFLESLEEMRTKSLTRAAATIQHRARTLICRSFFKHLRTEVIKLQTAARSLQQQKEFTHVRECVVRLQSASRIHEARKQLHSLQRNAAAVRIQKIFRRHECATTFVNIRAKTTKLQTIVRAQIQRRTFREMVEEQKRQLQIEYKMQKLQEMLETERKRREEAEAMRSTAAPTTIAPEVESGLLKGAQDTINTLQAQLAEERSKNKELVRQRKEAEERASKAEEHVDNLSAKLSMGTKNSRLSVEADEELARVRKQLKEANKKNAKFEEVLQEVLRKRAEEDELRLRLQKQLSELKDENGLLHEQLHMLKDIMREERTKYGKVLRLLQLQAQGVELPENILKRLNLSTQTPRPKQGGAGAPGVQGTSEASRQAGGAGAGALSSGTAGAASGSSGGNAGGSHARPQPRTKIPNHPQPTAQQQQQQQQQMPRNMQGQQQGQQQQQQQRYGDEDGSREKRGGRQPWWGIFSGGDQ